jgi:hypothetical protein
VLRGRCLVCNPINSLGPSSMYPVGFRGVKVHVHDDPLEVQDADDPIPLSQDSEFIQPTSFTGIPIRMPESDVFGSTSRSETAHSDSNKHSLFKALCACLFATVFVAAGTGVGVYFYFRDQNTSTTTSSTLATSTPTTPSLEVTVPETTQMNVVVETSQVPTDASTQYVSDPTSTEPMLRDASAIEHDIEANILCRGVKFSELSDTDSLNLALDWLLNDDEIQLDLSDPNLHQRFILALLAVNFGSTFEASVDWLSDTNECSWVGVTCDANGEVSKLELGKPFIKKLNS